MYAKHMKSVIRTILEHSLVILSLYLCHVRGMGKPENDNRDEPWKKHNNTQEARLPGSQHKLFEHIQAPGGYQMEFFGRL
jgi:hypothetical protein